MMTIGLTLNHIGSHPSGRTWQTPIYKNNQLVFISIGKTEKESSENALILFEVLEGVKFNKL